MARFRYVLQPALDFALARERVSLAALSQADSLAAHHAGMLAAIAARERRLRAHTGSFAREHRLAASLVDAAACYELLACERERGRQLLQKSRLAALAARLAAARKMQRRTALGCGRTRALEQWRHREELLEAGELDEANLMGQARAAHAWKDAS